MSNSNISNSLNQLSELLQQTEAEQSKTSKNADDKQFVKRRGRAIPPLEKWHPENCGDMNLVIKANGEWLHEFSNMPRQALIDLFDTGLWIEGNNDAPEYYLKTPVEKIRIEVEDVPFLVTDVNVIQQPDASGNPQHWLEFETSTGDVVVLDADHPLEMREFEGQDRPYMPIRFGMDGVLSRQVYMHLTELGEIKQLDDKTQLTLQSGGQNYVLSVAN